MELTSTLRHNAELHCVNLVLNVVRHNLCRPRRSNRRLMRRWVQLIIMNHDQKAIVDEKSFDITMS